MSRVTGLMYQILKKAGSRRNGWQSDTGEIYHAVPVSGLAALCGAVPRQDWGAWEGDEVTCPKCIKLIHNDDPTDEQIDAALDQMAHLLGPEFVAECEAGIIPEKQHGK